MPRKDRLKRAAQSELGKSASKCKKLDLFFRVSFFNVIFLICFFCKLLICSVSLTSMRMMQSPISLIRPNIFIWHLCPFCRYYLSLVPYLLALVPSIILPNSRSKWPCPKNYQMHYVSANAFYTSTIGWVIRSGGGCMATQVRLARNNKIHVLTV